MNSGSLSIKERECLESIVVANTEQLFRLRQEEAVILSLKNSAYYGLYEIGCGLYCVSRRASASCGTLLPLKYEVKAECCERDLLNLFEDMRMEGLTDVRSDTVR
jgi:hypothetical protein